MLKDCFYYVVSNEILSYKITMVIGMYNEYDFIGPLTQRFSNRMKKYVNGI